MEFQNPIFHKLATLNHLPTLPQILLKLIRTCNAESSNAVDIAGVVDKDPALSSRILRLVNSAHYGLSYDVSSIRQAVSLVGIGTVKNLAFCASVCEAFRKPGKASAFDLRNFWWHSLRCGLLSRLLAKEIQYPQPEEAFLCGLFHDIGMLVLWVHLGERYEKLLTEHMNREGDLAAPESRLGATHAEVGAWLLTRWNMPSFMADAVLYHHETEARVRGALPLVRVVYAAHLLVEEDGASEARLRSVESVLDVPAQYLKALVSEADHRIDSVAKALDVEVQAPEGADHPEEKAPDASDELAREVRDISLMQSTLEGLLKAQSRGEIVAAIRQGLQILFDTTEVLIFLSDPEGGSYAAALGNHGKGLFSANEIRVPLSLEESLLNACMAQGKNLHSFGETSKFPPERPILDDQITRYLKREGILCLPMRASGAPVGVIVIGFDRAELPFFVERNSSLKMFSQQAALALQAEKAMRERHEAVQAERLNAAYTLARKVSHEVNSPLSIIKNYLNLLGMKLGDEDVAQDEIRIINEEITRISDILGKLSALSVNSGERDRSAGRESVDVNTLLRDLSKLLHESLMERAGIELRLELADEFPRVLGEKDGLKQVFINLIRNAVEALEPGGVLTVKTGMPKKDTPDATTGGLPAEGGAEITITDNGPGVPEEMRARLFEPFVGTKGGGHFGLGLSIVYSLIDSMGGSISCEENPDGRGTTFRIRLPLAQGAGARQGKPHA